MIEYSGELTQVLIPNRNGSSARRVIKAMQSIPQLNLQVLQDSCKRLRALLQTYSNLEPDAALCLRELTPIFDQVMASQIHEPRHGAAPCGYYFHEGSLRKYPELEEAFSDFSMAWQGWDQASIKSFLSRKT